MFLSLSFHYFVWERHSYVLSLMNSTTWRRFFKLKKISKKNKPEKKSRSSKGVWRVYSLDYKKRAGEDVKIKSSTTETHRHLLVRKIMFLPRSRTLQWIFVKYFALVLCILSHLWCLYSAEVNIYVSISSHRHFTKYMWFSRDEISTSVGNKMLTDCRKREVSHLHQKKPL